MIPVISCMDDNVRMVVNYRAPYPAHGILRGAGFYLCVSYDHVPSWRYGHAVANVKTGTNA